MDRNSVVNFIALYNIEKMDWTTALQRARKFFDKICLQEDSIFYQEIIPIEKQEYDDGVRIVSYSELKKIAATKKDIRGISLSIQNKDKSRWDVNFHYYYDLLFHDQNYLIIEYNENNKSFSDTDFLYSLIKDISSSSEIPYGFACQLPYFGVKSYNYIDSQVFYTPLFPYEDSETWSLEVPSYMNDGIAPKRYLIGMLRLIYRYNFITEKHLNMKINGTTLQEWIVNNPDNGNLVNLTGNLWVWEVNENNLERINIECITSGLLISGKIPPKGQKTKIRLP